MHEVDPVAHREFTYKDILEKSIKLADTLPLVQDEIAFILLENNIHYYYILLACLFKGVIVHPIQPNATKYELNYIISISKVKAIFTSNVSLEKATELKKEFNFIENIINVETMITAARDGTVLNLADLIEESKADIHNFRIPVFDTTKIIAIFNSSGTTGLPKSVIVNYGNFNCILNYIKNPEFFDFGPEDVTVSVCPFYHLYGYLVVMFSLVTGMKSVIMNKFSFTKYLEFIQDYQATILFLVPPIANLLAKRSVVENYELKSLRDIICGSAPMGIEVEEILRRRLDINVRQIYGMTEATNFITAVPLKPKLGKSGSVGKPLPGCLIEIRHLTTNEVLPSKHLGQICLKGALISPGYFNNLEATKNAFDKHGFLFTGDVGYYDEDGYVYIVERLKEMIKYKGLQVAPAELEDLIMSHPGVNDVAVIGKPDEYAGEVAVAFVVKQCEDLTKDDIIKFVAKYMNHEKQLHGGVQFIEKIPKSAAGKILRKALREMLNVTCEANIDKN